VVVDLYGAQELQLLLTWRVRVRAHPRGRLGITSAEGRRMRGTDGSESASGALLTVAEVAGVLRVSAMTVYRLIRSGDLPALRIGKSYRIRQGALDQYLATGEVYADESNG
jgi:excisionase family DNA binding protein